MATPELAIPRAVRALVGQVVAERYLVEQIIGIGGMAIVFRGRHLGLQRDVAVKVLHPNYSDNVEIGTRFEREARAASGFDHPNLRQVFDVGFTQNGLKFMAMQLLEGRELSTIIGAPVPPSQCIHLVLQMLRGLDHAHQHGVIHRDLKPDNVFITRDHHGHEQVKIVDFGIAKITGDNFADGLTTEVGSIVGTPAYMSPEQALAKDVNGRADVYSVGIVLYELLTGAPPFLDPDARKLMQAHVDGRIPALPPSIPTIVTAALSKLIAREPRLRYPSAAAAILGLERVSRSMGRDPTPWLDLLGLPRTNVGGTPDTGVRKLLAVDDALKRLLAQHTPAVQDSLRSGVNLTPAIAELDLGLADMGDGEDPGRV